MLQRLADDVLQRDAPFGLQAVYVDPRLFGGRAAVPREFGWITAISREIDIQPNLYEPACLGVHSRNPGVDAPPVSPAGGAFETGPVA